MVWIICRVVVPISFFAARETNWPQGQLFNDVIFDSVVTNDGGAVSADTGKQKESAGSRLLLSWNNLTCFIHSCEAEYKTGKIMVGINSIYLD